MISWPTLRNLGAYDRLNVRIRKHGQQIVTNLYLTGFRSDWNNTYASECYVHRQPLKKMLQFVKSKEALSYAIPSSFMNALDRNAR